MDAARLETIGEVEAIWYPTSASVVVRAHQVRIGERIVTCPAYSYPAATWIIARRAAREHGATRITDILHRWNERLVPTTTTTPE
jgi:hypothetical protein